MVTFVKPISFVALESLKVSHFRPEIQEKTAQMGVFGLSQKLFRQICFSLCYGPFIVTFVEPITFDALESLESPKSWPERRPEKTAKTRLLELGRPFPPNLLKDKFL